MHEVKGEMHSDKHTHMEVEKHFKNIIEAKHFKKKHLLLKIQVSPFCEYKHIVTLNIEEIPSLGRVCNGDEHFCRTLQLLFDQLHGYPAPMSYLVSNLAHVF